MVRLIIIQLGHLSEGIDVNFAGWLVGFDAKRPEIVRCNWDVLACRLVFRCLAWACIPVVDEVYTLRFVQFENDEVAGLTCIGMTHVNSFALGQGHDEANVWFR